MRSAESALEKARLDLERTQIRAPFAGRVLRKLVDLGQVVSPNAQLAEIFATDIVEIRLPLRNRDLPFIDLPETYRYDDDSGQASGRVEIRSDLTGDATWDARLVRTEGAIDELLAMFAADRAWNEEAARKKMLTIFEALGPKHPHTLSGRRRLSSLMFS